MSMSRMCVHESATHIHIHMSHVQHFYIRSACSRFLHEYTCHDSYIRVTWLIHMWRTWLYVECVCGWVRMCGCVCVCVSAFVCVYVMRIKGSWFTCVCVMPHIWKRLLANMDESCHTLWMSHVTHVNAKKQMWSVLSHIWMWEFARRQLGTGWQSLIGSPKLQIIFHKRATEYKSLLRKMIYKDKGSYESSPPCMWICRAVYTYIYLALTKYFSDLTHPYVARQIHLHKTYGVATISRLLKIIGLFCKRAL